jgi:hypothetical protein
LIEYQKAPRRASTKNVSIVSISLKSEDFSLFGASACTKNEEEPKSVRTARYVIEDIGVSSLMISKSLKYRGSEFSKTILK